MGAAQGPAGSAAWLKAERCGACTSWASRRGRATPPRLTLPCVRVPPPDFGLRPAGGSSVSSAPARASGQRGAVSSLTGVQSPQDLPGGADAGGNSEEKVGRLPELAHTRSPRARLCAQLRAVGSPQALPGLRLGRPGQRLC